MGIVIDCNIIYEIIAHLILVSLWIWYAIRQKRTYVWIGLMVYIAIFWRTFLMIGYFIYYYLKLIITKDRNNFQLMSQHIFCNIFGLSEEWDHLARKQELQGLHYIYVCNYPTSVLDYLIIGLFPNVSTVRQREKLGAFCKQTLSLVFDDSNTIGKDFHSGNFENMKTQVAEHIKRTSILVFPEDASKKTTPAGIGPFKSGFFSIAKELGIPIIPIKLSSYKIIDPLGFIPEQHYQIHQGDIIKIKKSDDINKITERVRNWMLSQSS